MGLSRPGKRGNEHVLHTPKISQTGALTIKCCLVSHQGCSFLGAEGNTGSLFSVSLTWDSILCKVSQLMIGKSLFVCLLLRTKRFDVELLSLSCVFVGRGEGFLIKTILEKLIAVLTYFFSLFAEYSVFIRYT